MFSVKITVEVSAISDQFQFLSICRTSRLKGRKENVVMGVMIGGQEVELTLLEL
jgi:hypothetical protein